MTMIPIPTPIDVTTFDIPGLNWKRFDKLFLSSTCTQIFINIWNRSKNTYAAYRLCVCASIDRPTQSILIFGSIHLGLYDDADADARMYLSPSILVTKTNGYSTHCAVLHLTNIHTVVLILIQFESRLLTFVLPGTKFVDK